VTARAARADGTTFITTLAAAALLWQWIFDPSRGLRWNPPKLLTDPYAKAV